MKFTVVWAETAEAELARLWLESDSASRAEITTATLLCDNALKTDAHLVGRPRFGIYRTVVIAPLLFEFEFILDDRLARVLAVHHLTAEGFSPNGKSEN